MAVLENIRGWWEIRHLPNVRLVHFNDLKRDLPGQVRDIADFLDIEMDETTFPAIVEHCSFGYMKAHASDFTADFLWEGGGATFINKGTNDRWRDVLTPEEVRRLRGKGRRPTGPGLRPLAQDWRDTLTGGRDRQPVLSLVRR